MTLGLLRRRLPVVNVGEGFRRPDRAEIMNRLDERAAVIGELELIVAVPRQFGIAQRHRLGADVDDLVGESVWTAEIMNRLDERAAVIGELELIVAVPRQF